MRWLWYWELDFFCVHTFLFLFFWKRFTPKLPDVVFRIYGLSLLLSLFNWTCLSFTRLHPNISHLFGSGKIQIACFMNNNINSFWESADFDFFFFFFLGVISTGQKRGLKTLCRFKGKIAFFLVPFFPLLASHLLIVCFIIWWIPFLSILI